MTRQLAKRNGDAKSSSAERSGQAGFRRDEASDALTPAQREILQMQGSAGNRAVQGLIGGSQPLPQPVLGEMESRFSTELSDVRIHDDAQAHASAERLGAKAYTSGEHIVFGAERYAPDSWNGKRLLAHELAHVIQQRRGGAAPGPDSNSFSEQAADRAAGAFASSSAPVAVSGGTAAGIARAETEEERKKRETFEEYRERGGKVKEGPKPKKQPAGDVLGRIPTSEDKAASRQRALESIGASTEDPTPINTRSWKDQGREEHQGALRRLAHERDPKIIPEPVRADLERQLKAMEKLMETREYDETKHRLRLPKGYVLGHFEGAEGDPTTPAREGYDYENARVITVEQNQAEERLRRETAKLEGGKPAGKGKKAPATATPPTIRRKATPEPAVKPNVASQKAPVAGKPSAFIGPAPEPSRVAVARPSVADVPAAPTKQLAPTPKAVPSLHSPVLGEAQVARARNVGTVLGFGLGLLSGYALDKYKDWMVETLASGPPAEINEQSIQDYLKNSPSSMRVIDLLAKDVAGFSNNIREKARQAIDMASLAALATTVASPAVRIETLNRLGEDIGTVVDELATIRNGAEAALELETEARNGISSARELADYILKKKPSALNTLVWDQLVKLGLSIDQILKIHDNLRAYAARLQPVLDDLHDLQAAASEMHLQTSSFASTLNRLYWSEVLQAAKSAQQRVP
jgi:hypothetical protein